LKRAKHLAQQGADIHASPALKGFIYEALDRTRFFADEAILDQFCLLDDSDVLAALKVWQFHDDFVLREVSRRIVHRDLFRIDLRPEAFAPDELESLVQKTAEHYQIALEDARYLVINDRIDNRLYASGGITIRFKNGTKADFADASDQLSREILMRTVAKSFVCYPKELAL
jgi:hypothetical protein